MKTKKTKKRKINDQDQRDICKEMLEIVHKHSKEIQMDYSSVVTLLANLSVSFAASIADNEDEFHQVTAVICAEVIGLAGSYSLATNVGNQTAH
jgi:hypothetical protein